MTGTTTFNSKAAVHEPLRWRLGLLGSILILLALLPIPLQPQTPLCGFLWLTGRPCPFCGITRALSCLLKGDFTLALSFHPLSPVALVALLMVFLGGPCRIVWQRAGWRTISTETIRFFWAGSLWVFLIYGSWRILVGNPL